MMSHFRFVFSEMSEKESLLLKEQQEVNIWLWLPPSCFLTVVQSAGVGIVVSGKRTGPCRVQVRRG